MKLVELAIIDVLKNLEDKCTFFYYQLHEVQIKELTNY